MFVLDDFVSLVILCLDVGVIISNDLFLKNYFVYVLNSYISKDYKSIYRM
jgi:hypothetical protein